MTSDLRSRKRRFALASAVSAARFATGGQPDQAVGCAEAMIIPKISMTAAKPDGTRSIQAAFAQAALTNGSGPHVSDVIVGRNTMIGTKLKKKDKEITRNQELGQQFFS